MSAAWLGARDDWHQTMATMVAKNNFEKITLFDAHETTQPPCLRNCRINSGGIHKTFFQIQGWGKMETFRPARRVSGRTFGDKVGFQGVPPPLIPLRQGFGGPVLCELENVAFDMATVKYFLNILGRNHL
jgi:hypothetical protein